MYKIQNKSSGNEGSSIKRGFRLHMNENQAITNRVKNFRENHQQKNRKRWRMH